MHVTFYYTVKGNSAAVFLSSASDLSFSSESFLSSSLLFFLEPFVLCSTLVSSSAVALNYDMNNSL